MWDWSSVEACKVNWTEILERGHVPEPPGRTEIMEDISARPYKAPVKKTGRKK